MNVDNMSLDEQLSVGKALLNNDGEESNTAGANTNTNSSPNTNNPSNRIIQSMEVFENLQQKIQSAGLYSNNESLNDIPTSSLALLSVEYHLAKAHLQLPSQESKQRFKYVTRAIELFHLFLGRCHSYESLFDVTLHDQYTTLLSVHDSYHNDGNDGNEDSHSHSHSHNHNHNYPNSNDSTSTYKYKLPPPSRDEKIQQYKLSKNISTQIANHKYKLQQRSRLSIPKDDVFDGYDYDGLLRILTIQELNVYGLDSFSEIHSSSLELQMLEMKVKSEEQMQHEQHYRHGRRGRGIGEQQQQQQEQGYAQSMQRRLKPESNKPLALTHVTQHPITNQLLFQKEVIQKTIFRPSWNQPTMSLEELGAKEVEEAMARANRQEEAEKEKINQPRRYEYLVKDGLEDDDKLVDGSAKLDREWDDWKDENPRGSGNKMGDVGDRNF